jgi:hypothetical protein
LVFAAGRPRNIGGATTFRRGLYFVIAGSLWGGLAYLLGAKAFGSAIWGGVLASPGIGLVVGWITQSRFERLSGFLRALFPLGTVYIGATLFGLTVGLYDGVSGTAGRIPSEVVLQAVLAVWWGVTFTGFLLVLWPLAYATHAMVQWSDEA